MSKKDVYDLTNPQKSIWLTEEVFKGTTINNVCTSGTIHEKIDVDLLKKAINNVARQHDSFRIRIILENNTVKQYISDFKNFDIDVEYINAPSELQKIEADEAKHIFNILDSDLFKFKIVILKDKFACIILTANHIISDSWAMGITIQEILRNYHCLQNDETPDSEVPSYVDYINSENNYKKSSKYEKDKNYWKNVFETIPEQATIPSLTKNTSELSRSANRFTAKVDKNIVLKVNAFCKANHFSVFNFLMAILGIYIGRVSNSQDFVIGTPILNRTNFKEKRTTGMFVNTVPVRLNNLNDGLFTNFVNSLSQKMREVLRHQKYSYTSILEDLRSNNKTIPNLYNILISYQITKAFDEKYGNYDTNWTFSNYIANDIDIHISDINDTGNLVINYDYLISKYKLQDIQDLHSRILHMINQVLNNTEILTSEIEIVTKEEKQKILYEFNNTAVDYPKDKTIADLFEEQVEKTPDNIAVVFEDKSLTYKELNQKANSLAHYLQTKEKINRNDLVGIMVNRSLEMIVAILAVLKAGGAYIPIDPTYPKDRVNYMLDSSNAKVLLTQEHLKDKVTFENKLFIDLNNTNIYNVSTDNLKNINKPGDLAYVIFTSGSTGKPKGVMLKQKNIVNFIYGMMEEFKFSPADTIASITTISFDIFVLESLMPLLNGLKIVIANEQEQTNAKLFNKLCLKNNVDIIQTTPSRMQVFMTNPDDLQFIKNSTHILLGGEPFPAVLLNNLKQISNSKIYNMYGPTETAVWSTLKDLTDTNTITVGKPIINTQVYILDNNLKPTPVGISGDIYISGDGVSKGYLNRPVLTEKSFINNPFIPNNTMYKTGDLGMYMPDGNIICLGRSDSQVKIRGLRIELGEIEDKLNSLPAINSCAVVKKTDSNSSEFLCAYFTANSKMDSKSIQKDLEEFLPKYMIPRYFVQMDNLPYTPNGKIDRKSLPEPQIQNSNKKIIPPRNGVDAKLVALLKELLNICTVSIDDDLFDLGVDSLSAINLCANIQNAFNAQIFVKDILEHPVVQDLSDIISESINTYETHVITPAPKAEYYEVSSAQKRMYFASSVTGNSPTLYNIPGGVILDGNIDIQKLEQCFNTLINRHEALRTYFELNNNTVVQKIMENANFKLDVLDNIDFKNINTVFKEFVKPFDLATAPLFRAKFVQFTNGKSAFFVDMHHIISDGTSLAILTDELCKLYNDESLPKLKITYKDFANFENTRLNSGSLKAAEEYWVHQFEGELPVLNMPTNYSRPAVQSFEGKKIYSSIDNNTVKQIEQLSKDLGVTPYIILLSCYYILLSKYTSQDDIIVGSPVVGRDILDTYNLIGMFVNTLALRNTVNNKLSFKDFVLSIKENILNAYKYQTYPFDELINKLNIKRDTSRNPLFDTMFIYQNNGYKELNFKNISSEYYMPDTSTSKFDLSVEAVPSSDHIDLTFEYATSLFSEEFITRLSKHYSNILAYVLNDINTQISNIDMLSKEEKQKILYEFNSTAVDYPKDKTIVNLFEEQVEKTPDNIAVVFGNKSLTYKELNQKANSLANYLRTKEKINRNDLVGIMVNRSLEMIVAILAVLKAGGAYIPIDPTYPKDRVNYMLDSSNAKVLLTQGHLKDKVTFENKLFIDLNNTNIYNESKDNLKNINKPDDLAYVIFTSGSTGKPKGVMVLHKSLSNLTNYCNQYIDYLKSPKYRSIVSITTISFDIFFFETIISLQKGLKLVIASEDEQNSPTLLNALIEKHKIEIIQSTPSRMQTFIDNINSIPSFRKLKYVTLAGEQLPLKLVQKLYNLSDVTIYNGYGPSETTVFSTLTKMNNKLITIGKPLNNTQMYILDANLSPVPIGISGELYISGDGVGKGYLNNLDLTNKSFIPNPFVTDTLMYKTGDLGMYMPNGNIICLGRSDSQVKIRGLRIELGEIEDKLNSLPAINSCAVVKRTDNNLREFLCAYFTANTKIESKKICDYLGKFLPKYMIPTYFTQMDSLPYTPNGKIDRKNLPEPKIQDTNKEITPPRNDIDIKLIALLKELLNINAISIDDDLFDLGIDSLSAITLSTQIQKEFNAQLLVRDILEHPEVQKISDIISKNHNNKEQTIDYVAKAEYYEASSAQKRMFFASQMAGYDSIHYNIPGGIVLDGNINAKKLEQSINTLINRHEALRTYFELNNDTVVQKILENANFKLDILDNADFNNIDNIFNEFIKPFDLATAPLFRAKYIQFTNGKSAIFIDMHHIISDGTSLGIFTDELCKLYNGESLSELKITYKDFATFENNRLKSNLLKETEEYWVHQFDGEIPVLNMPTNYPRPAVQSFDGEKIYSSIDNSTVKQIEQLSKNLGVTPYIILLSCYYILLSKYTSQDDIVIGSPVVGRDIADTYNLIGMFVNTLALRNTVNDMLSFKDFVSNIKENVLKAYDYQTYPFDELVNKLNIKRDTSRNPLFDTMFIYQNNGYKDIHLEGIGTEYYIPDTNISKFDLSLEAVPQNGKISLSFEYATKLFDKGFIQNLSSHYLNIVNSVLENTDIKISDIDMLSKEEKQKILYEFNNTSVDYPKDKTIVDLFEEQVEKTPDNIAVVFENKSLTYKELNEKANSLANYLRTKEKINRNDLVGIMVNRSLEMIVAILAVLKAGGAYIPIDPTYPKDRVNYMLDSSNAKVLLTQDHLKDKVTFENKLFIDLNNTNIYDASTNNIENVNKSDDLAYVIFTSGSTGKPKGVMVTHRVLSNFTNYCNNYVEYLKNPEYQAIASITTVSFDIFFYETIISLQRGLKVVIANENEQNTPTLLNDLITNQNVKIIQATPSRMQIFINNIENMPNLKNLKYVILAGEQLPLSLVNSLHAISDITVYNGYGPSETYYSTLTKMNDEFVTIGKPIYNTQMYILDKNLKPVPVGVCGEIYIAGEAVGKGYLNNPELTAKSFIKDPFIQNNRMYKTGDLGMYMPDGNIICLGRVDNQIKIRGLRIELEEIEALILQYPHVTKVAIIKQTIQNREFISCYYVADKRINKNALRKHLTKALPMYMVPSYFIALDDLPYTPNGKIDRKALPLPTELLNISQENYIAPKTKLQRQLVNIWEKILNTKPIGIYDNFFELGGDSLLAMNMNIELLKISNKITYADIFRYPTIAELEEKINSNTNMPLFNKIDSLSDKYVDVLKNTKNKEKLISWHPKNILLTGATGFLGIHILEEFLKNEDVNIYCIVREEPGLTSRAKLHQKLNYYFGNKYDNLLDTRIFAVTGDTSKSGFGLNQEELLKLANSVDVIINSAANVAHFGNYADFYKANVTSVKLIVDFCKTFNKKLYHISTEGVAGSDLDVSYLRYSKKRWFRRDKNNNIIFDESCLYIGQILENVYTRSKFEAESYVLTSISDGLDGYILRMGYLMPRYSDGVFQENILDNDLINKIVSFIKIEAIPDYLYNYKLEFTPVDDAANAIYKLVSHPTKTNRIFHLYNHNYISVAKLLKTFKKLEHEIMVISEDDFKSKINSILENEESKELLKNLLDDFDNNLHLNYTNDIIMKSNFTIKYLRKLNFRWHKISNKYIDKLINLLRKVI